MRRDLLAGVDALADAVAVTLGPRGRNVVIEHRAAGLPPVATKDGVTVAQAVELSGRTQSVGVSLVRQMATTVAKEAGDGTTTSVVLTRRLAAETRKALAAGINPRDIVLGMEKAARIVESRSRRARTPLRRCARARACRDVGGRRRRVDRRDRRRCSDARRRWRRRRCRARRCAFTTRSTSSKACAGSRAIARPIS